MLFLSFLPSQLGYVCVVVAAVAAQNRHRNVWIRSSIVRVHAVYVAERVRAELLRKKCAPVFFCQYTVFFFLLLLLLQGAVSLYVAAALSTSDTCVSWCVPPVLSPSRNGLCPGTRPLVARHMCRHTSHPLISSHTLSFCQFQRYWRARGVSMRRRWHQPSQPIKQLHVRCAGYSHPVLRTRHSRLLGHAMSQCICSRRSSGNQRRTR